MVTRIKSGYAYKIRDVEAWIRLTNPSSQTAWGNPSQSRYIVYSSFPTTINSEVPLTVSIVILNGTPSEWNIPIEFLDLDTSMPRKILFQHRDTIYYIYDPDNSHVKGFEEGAYPS